MPIPLHSTSRGFTIGEFTDRYGRPCSIQESSLATEACLWLGKDGAMMHLTQEQAADLLPLLQHFAETGELPPPFRTELPDARA